MKKLFPILSYLNIVIAIILLNVLVSSLVSTRFDLTRNKVHSLSERTGELISSLDDIVRVKVYLSEELPPEVEGIASNLKIVLGEMEKTKGGNFVVEYYDPGKDAEVEAEAERLGIEKLQFSTSKKDKFEMQEGYFGLSINKGDKKIVLPVAGDVGNLEYLIVSAIKKLEKGSLGKLGVAEEVWDLSKISEIEYLREYLANEYDVVPVNLDDTEESIKDLDALLIVGRVREIDARKIDEIRQWQEEGGSLVALIDKYRVSSQLESNMVEEENLFNYLEEKGFSVKNNLVIDKSSAIASFGGEKGNFLTQYPYWIQVQKEGVNREVPAMSGVVEVMLPWVSEMEVSLGAEAILRSSGESMTRSGEGMLSPSNQIVIPEGSEREIVLGGINREKRTAVIADADFIRDQFLKSNSSNLVMALNLVDYFSGDEDLLTIRSKKIEVKGIGVLEDNEKTIYRVVAMISPLLIIGLSLLVTNLLRRRANR